MNTPTILQTIIATKRAEVEQRKSRTPQAELEQKIESVPKPRDFHAALVNRVNHHQAAVIAEFKRASPSAGWINQHADPAVIAKAYESAGAACMSVLTDAEFFRGSEQDLINAREACSLPVIRKDFIVDQYQVYETRALGADAILLIVAALDDEQLQSFSKLAHELDLSVLVEVHDSDELDRALAIPGNLIGINNRDLHQFVTRLETSLELAGQVPKDRVVIAESGIHQRADIARLNQAGIYSFLIGEALMKSANPQKAFQLLINADQGSNPSST